jgi:hypothetical protein
MQDYEDFAHFEEDDLYCPMSPIDLQGESLGAVPDHGQRAPNNHMALQPCPSSRQFRIASPVMLPGILDHIYLYSSSFKISIALARVAPQQREDAISLLVTTYQDCVSQSFSASLSKSDGVYLASRMEFPCG